MLSKRMISWGKSKAKFKEYPTHAMTTKLADFASSVSELETINAELLQALQDARNAGGRDESYPQLESDWQL